MTLTIRAWKSRHVRGIPDTAHTGQWVPQGRADSEDAAWAAMARLVRSGFAVARADGDGIELEQGKRWKARRVWM